MENKHKIEIGPWIRAFTENVLQAFPERVWFVGLQGSYGRGEATDTSDIDVVVILDELQFNDLTVYRDLLEKSPNRDSICGFLSGKDELLHWEPSDLFQFYHDTTPIVGSLEPLLEKIDRQAVKRAIKIGACNIYHACVHNYLHGKSDDILRSLYKSAVFVIQAGCYFETGKYIKSHAQLQSMMEPPSAVLETAQRLKNGEKIQFDRMSELLLNWSKSIIVWF